MVIEKIFNIIARTVYNCSCLGHFSLSLFFLKLFLKCPEVYIYTFSFPFKVIQQIMLLFCWILIITNTFEYLPSIEEISKDYLILIRSQRYLVDYYFIDCKVWHKVICEAHKGSSKRTSDFTQDSMPCILKLEFSVLFYFLILGFSKCYFVSG